MTATGPSTKVICRILNRNSCGSGSVVGLRNGKSLILTNAHVAGSRVGRVVKVEIESTGDKIDAKVIMAAYSDRTWTDWAVLETLEDYDRVTPVKLSKNRPTGSHYTKGFPRCQPFPGSDIRTVDLSTTDARWLWQPNAIGGQSGSGVWSDVDDLQFGLITWSIGRDGAGQMTSEIYRQAKNCTVAGEARVPDMIELVEHDYDLPEIRGNDDPIVEPGFFAQRDITTLPIWAGEDDIEPPADGDEPDPNVIKALAIAALRQNIESSEEAILKIQGITAPVGKPDPGNDDAFTYGL